MVCVLIHSVRRLHALCFYRYCNCVVSSVISIPSNSSEEIIFTTINFYIHPIQRKGKQILATRKTTAQSRDDLATQQLTPTDTGFIGIRKDEQAILLRVVLFCSALLLATARRAQWLSARTTMVVFDPVVEFGTRSFPLIFRPSVYRNSYKS